ncbi:hypothetical protein [Streptomyces sp. ID01-9D]|uniref:hypothetical protein n=1 Tax=Streptomyces sp. ID01-9D TaxID=3028659 RepID=UPI0029C135B2|nr:hypothetical protein [Streptomyces sp. ID01-9D]MDX5576005.1 hypothetical protein [Streptomyces sp. ID01-9D]
MGFDEEWAELRGEAAARQDVRMRLNQLAPASDGGGGSDFGTDSAQKKAASGKLAGEIKTQTENAGKKSDEETAAAITGFAGWDTAAGLKTAEETWNKQVKNLLGRLATESHNLGIVRSLYLGRELEVYEEFQLLKRQPPFNGPNGWQGR